MNRQEVGYRGRHTKTSDAPNKHAELTPGKGTLTEQLPPIQLRQGAGPPSSELAGSAIALPAPAQWPDPAARATIHSLFGAQRVAAAAPAEDPAQVHAAAARGTATSATKLPFADQIQRAFGRHDISGIQAHVEADAAASAREMGADAYAMGNHVVLGSGTNLYTVAHEAAHVVQQRGGVQLKGAVGEVGDAYERHADQVAGAVTRGESAEALLNEHASTGGASADVTRAGPIQRRLSPRFADVNELGLVESGRMRLVEGYRGPAIQKIQQALADLGYKVEVSGVFDEALGEVMKAFQNASSLEPTGQVDQETMRSLDNSFADRTAYASLARHRDITAPADTTQWDSPPIALLERTRDLSDGERRAAQTAISRAPVNRNTGKPPEFINEMDGLTYEMALTDLLDRLIRIQFNRVAADKAEAHSDPEKLHSFEHLEDVGEQSKKVADQTFGSYRIGPAIRAGVNLEDKFEREDARIAGMSPGQKHAKAKWRIEKIMREKPAVAELNKKHNVVWSRSPDQDIIDKVVNELAERYQPMLLAIQRAWPASADSSTSTIYIQRFKGPSGERNRRDMWSMFTRLVHEYIHTLEHGEWHAYKNRTAGEDKNKAQTLREGVTEFLARAALSVVDGNDRTLRKAVEGSYYDETASDPIPPRAQYQADVDRTDRLVGTVGAPNLYAAYFLGQVDKIGGAMTNRGGT